MSFGCTIIQVSENLAQFIWWETNIILNPDICQNNGVQFLCVMQHYTPSEFYYVIQEGYYVSHPGSKVDN